MASFKPFKGQNYAAIKCQHNDEKLFTDDKFPPKPKSLSHTGKKFADLQWRRPKDIVQNPEFVINSFHRGDIDQGGLANCWFLAGAAALTLHPDLLERVVPPNQSFDRHNYAGIFHFRFWINGEWCDVVIDDNLPCTSKGNLAFCHNDNKDDKNEMWSALLEKAFAKVCGSYEAMENGFPVEAMIAMSGGIGQTFALHHEDPNMRKFRDKLELKRVIYEACEYDSLIASSIDYQRSGEHNPKFGTAGERNPKFGTAGEPDYGLVKGHAYSITGIAEVHVRAGPVTIIRCSSPWGNNKEWTGTFSDNSPIWNEDEMSEWNTITFHGKWIRGKTAAGCGNGDNSRFFNNPQYLIEIDSNGNDQENRTILVSLLQKDFRQRRLRGTEPLSIGFSICKVNNQRYVQRGTQQGNYKFSMKQVTRVDDSGGHYAYVEVTKRFSVSPGIYVLIPSTFEPDQEGDFLLRVFTELKIIRQEDDPEEGDSLVYQIDGNDSSDDDDYGDETDDNFNNYYGASANMRRLVPCNSYGLPEGPHQFFSSDCRATTVTRYCSTYDMEYSDNHS